MELKGERVLPAARASAWALLNDPEVLQRCVPGCESMTSSGAQSYELTLTAAVGPVKARFKSRLTLADVQPPVRYRLVFEGQSGPAGFVRGEAAVQLEEVSARETRMSYAAQATIGGKLAQVGARLIDAGAAATAEKFFAAFAAELAARESPAAASATARAAPRPGFWRWLAAVLRHLFARRS